MTSVRDSILLSYVRTPSCKFDGTVSTSCQSSRRVLAVITEQDFAGVLTALSAEAVQLPDASISIVRGDAPGDPMTLPDAECVMLREDLNTYIDKLTVAPITHRSGAEKPKAVLSVSLRGGYDTLADSFGADVYVAYRLSDDKNEPQVESPISGRWISLVTHQGVSYLDVVGSTCEVVVKCKRWATISTKTLIEISRSSDSDLYLPRRWNTSGLKISGNDLRKMYETFIKEKSNV